MVGPSGFSCRNSDNFVRLTTTWGQEERSRDSIYFKRIRTSLQRSGPGVKGGSYPAVSTPLDSTESSATRPLVAIQVRSFVSDSLADLVVSWPEKRRTAKRPQARLRTSTPSPVGAGTPSSARCLGITKPIWTADASLSFSIKTGVVIEIFMSDSFAPLM